MIVKTAGSYLSEERLRAYIKCSEFYEYGGLEELSFPALIARSTIEELTSSYLRKQLTDTKFDLQAATLRTIARLPKSEVLMESQLEKYLRECVLFVDEFFNMFSFSKYIPIYGPIEPIVQVSRTPVRLHISGIYRSKVNQTLHAVAFAPRTTKHTMLNDAPSHLKLKILAPLIRKRTKSRVQVQMHLLGYGRSGAMSYVTYNSNETNPKFLDMITTVVKQIEAGYHYPVLPCLFRCPYHNICKPALGTNFE